MSYRQSLQKIGLFVLGLTLFFLAVGGNSMAQEMTVHQFTMETIGGQQKALSEYAGKAILIVNTASKCGFTPQYGELQKLYEKYKDRGLEILAFPANNFMRQEPGTNEEIKKFCDLKFKIKFPLFAKISVKGKDAHPLFVHLTTQPGMEGDVSWNFNKFLVDTNGKLVARFGSRTKPDDKELLTVLEKTLPQA